MRSPTISHLSCIGMVAGLTASTAAHRLALPQSRRRMTSLQNRTALFNIASIFCLSMLFSKNSGKNFPDPFEKNTSQHPQHCPISRAYSQGSLPLSQLRRIKRVIFNIAHFCALSNPFRKFFRFFFRSQARPSPTLKFAFQINFEENTGSQENRHRIKYTQIL